MKLVLITLLAFLVVNSFCLVSLFGYGKFYKDPDPLMAFYFYACLVFFIPIFISILIVIKNIIQD